MVSASDVCYVVISNVVTMTPCSGGNCGCIAQYAIERQTRSRQGELRNFFYDKTLKLIIIQQMLVVGPLFQIAAFLVQFLALPFPLFASSFALGGIGIVFQVGIIYIFIKNYKR